jgi:2-haloacid dehalogenase
MTEEAAVDRIVAFDVNETLLDLSSLDPAFEELFGSSAPRAPWFAQMLQLSFVGGLTGRYVDFRTAQLAALQMVAARERVRVTSRDAERLVDGMMRLAPHPEVPDAIARLREAPITIVALVNSLAEVGEAQLAHAGIRHLFDAVISADEVRRLKPSPEPYLFAARRFDQPIQRLRLVAAHSWDVSGALAAGAAAAFVARPGMVLSSLGPRPDIVGDDVAEVVDAILAGIRGR